MPARLSDYAYKPVSYEEPRVLFFTPFGGWLVHSQVDAVLGSALKARNVPVQGVLCDGVYNIDVRNCYAIRNSTNPQLDCSACAQTGRSIFDTFAIPAVQIRDYMTEGSIARWKEVFNDLDGEHLRAFTFKHKPFGERLLGPLCSYHRITHRMLNDPDVLETHRLYLSFCMATYEALEGVFNEFRPTHVVMWNGSGYANTAAYFLADEKNVSIITHERGLYDGSYMFTSEDFASASSTFLRLSKAWSGIPLTTDEATRVRDHFESMEEGRDTNFLKFYEFSTEAEGVRHFMDIPPDAKIFTVFTSSEWEVAYDWQTYGLKSIQMDTIDRLIQIFSDNPDFKNHYLVVRHHPSMGMGPTGPSRQVHLLRRAYEQAVGAPDNVRIIQPDEKITSYALLWNAEACITFGSTLRLEGPAKGVPSASIDSAISYQGVPHVIIDRSTEGLTSLLKNMLANYRNFKVSAIRDTYRFTHMFRFQHSVTLKSISIKDVYEPTISIQSLDELLPGNDPALDRICDHIVNGSSIYQLPQEEHWLRDDADEEAFLKEELDRLRARRKKIRDASIVAAKSNTSLPSIAGLHFGNPNSPPTQNKFSSGSERQFYGNLDIFSFETFFRDKEVDQWVQGIRESAHHDYVVLLADQFQYDERWLRHMVQELAESPTSVGARSAAWVKNDSGIVSSIFSSNPLIDSCERAVELLPILEYPYFFLSFALFKREALIECLASSLTREVNSIGQYFFERLSKDDILQLPNPMILVDCSERGGEEEHNSDQVSGQARGIEQGVVDLLK